MSKSGGTTRNEENPKERSRMKETRGSGSDLNSDARRLQDPENLQDKIEEDTFPASDPPSNTPVTGVGRSRELPKDFK